MCTNWTSPWNAARLSDFWDNGAGKTTTMRMITGYLHPSEGSVLVDGVSVHDQGRSVRSKIGYLPETPPLYPDMTVQSYLKFVANLRDVPAREVKLRISEMVSRLGLQGRENRWCADYPKVISSGWD